MAQQFNRQIDPFNNIIYGNLDRERKFLFSGNMAYPFNIEAVGVTNPDKDYFISRNRSDYHVIEFISSGKGQLTVNGQTFNLQQGDIYILPPESTHSYRADKDDPFKKLWCNFYSDTFTKIQSDYGLTGKYVFHAPDCETYFHELIEVTAFGSFVNDNEWAKIATILMSILNKIAQHEYHPEGSTAIATRAKEILDNAIFDNITIEEIAKQLFVSKMLLSQQFKKIYGISPYHYYLNKKLSQAKLMLHYSNMTIKEISNKLCFVDEHYFSGLFKRKVGVTPSTFRKTLS